MDALPPALHTAAWRLDSASPDAYAPPMQTPPRSSFRIILAVLFGLTLSGGAQEWTRFRGPNGSGIGKANLPDQLTEKDINWRCDLPGTGHSSPVVWGDRVFVTCTPKSGPDSEAKRIVVCVGAKDGKIQWQRELATGVYRKHADNSFASPSCAVDAERVYVWTAGPDQSALVALGQADGREIWRQSLGPFQSQHGPGASPLVEGKVLFLQSSQDEPGSFIEAFDAATGKPLWKNELKGGQHSIATPCLLPTPKGPQLISLSTDNGLLGLDPATGKQLWAIADIFKLRTVASPVVTDGGLIIAQCGQGQANSEIQAVAGAAESKPKKAYEIVRIGGYVPTPLATGDLLFLWKENGYVTCVRAATNEQLWSERTEGPYYGSPVCIGGKGGRLYNVTRRGDLVVVGAEEKFRVIQRFPLGEGSYATPALSGGRMYIRTFSQLLSIGK
jgi:outer membrane protein assembly factor BamB